MEWIVLPSSLFTEVSAFGTVFFLIIGAGQVFAHVFHLSEKAARDKNGAFEGAGQRQAITWAGVDFHKFGPQLVLLAQDEPGKKVEFLRAVITTRSNSMPNPWNTNPIKS